MRKIPVIETWSIQAALQKFHKYGRMSVVLLIALVICLIFSIWWSCFRGNKPYVCNMDSGLLLNYNKAFKLQELYWNLFSAVSETVFYWAVCFPSVFLPTLYFTIFCFSNTFVHLSLFNHNCPSFIYFFSFFFSKNSIEVTVGPTNLSHNCHSCNSDLSGNSSAPKSLQSKC